MTPRTRYQPYLLLAPTALVLVVFFIYPLGVAVRQSFWSWDLLTPPLNVGFRNYDVLLANGELVGTALRTLGYSAIVVSLSMAFGLSLALALNRPGALYAFFRGAVFSAYVVSWVAVALLWMAILDTDGLVTTVFRAVGLPTTSWLGDPRTALVTIALVSVWKITG